MFIRILLLLLASGLASAEMERIDDSRLASVTGQGGMYLSGEVSFNKDGGVFAEGEHDYFGTCTEAGKVCGARISFQTEQSGGWFVIDNIRGSIAFEGLTFQLRNIVDGFGGDGALFNRDVIEIGLPKSVRMKDFQYTLATSNLDRPSTDANYKQVDFMTVEMSGDITLQGNLLVFPTD